MDLSTLTTGDVVSIAIMTLMAFKVSLKGFSYELSSKAGVFLGLLCSLMFSSNLSLFIDSRFGLGRYSLLLSLVILFLIGYVSAKALLSTLDEMFEVLHLRFFDHVLGFALGAAEGAIIVSVAVYLLRLQDVFDLEQVLSLSRIVTTLSGIAPVGIETVMKEIRLP